MKHTVEQITPTKVKLSVEVDSLVWKEHQEKAFHKLAQNVKVDGFRPGKAPEAMLRARVKTEDIWNEAIDSVLTPAYVDGLSNAKLNPFSRPDVNIAKISPTELTVEYTFVLAPEVELGAYKGLKAKKPEAKVSEKEIKESIDKLLEGNADLVLVEREAKMGDSLTLDFKGFLADEEGKLTPFEGGEASNYNLVLGSHSFVPGFEEALVGVKPGEDKEIKVTFPEAYVENLAGKEATFRCKIHEIKEKQIPELNDEAVEDLGLADVKTVEQLKEHQKTTLLNQKKTEIDNAFYNDLIKQIVDGSKFKIDESIIDNEVNARMEQFHQQLAQQGLSEEQYFQITQSNEEALRAQYRAEAEPNVKAYLALHEIGHVEKIEATDEDVEAEIKRMADQYRMGVDEIRGYVEKDLEGWKHNIADRKVRDFIISSSVADSPKPKAKAEDKTEDK